MTDHPLALPAIAEWHAMELGLIAFPAEPQHAVDQTWWQDLTGGEATSTRKRFARSDQGQYNGRVFVLEIDPLRIAWKFGVLIDGDRQDPGPPTAGQFVETRDLVVELMDRWLAEMCPPITRLAFVGKLMLPTATREDAYRLLDGFLPSVSVDPASREFQFRINRRRATTVAIPGLIINRLIVWSGIKINLQMRAVNPNFPEESTLTDNEYNGCLLQLDINTDPDFGTQIPPEHVVALWHELARLGTEIAEHGDRP